MMHALLLIIINLLTKFASFTIPKMSTWPKNVIVDIWGFVASLGL